MLVHGVVNLVAKPAALALTFKRCPAAQSKASAANACRGTLTMSVTAVQHGPLFMAPINAECLVLLPHISLSCCYYFYLCAQFVRVVLVHGVIYLVAKACGLYG
jgi:hypothetical protein